MTKDQIKSFCSKDEFSDTFTPDSDYVLLYAHEMVLDIDFENDFVTTLQGTDHFGEYANIWDWSSIEVYKRILE